MKQKTMKKNADNNLEQKVQCNDHILMVKKEMKKNQKQENGA